MRTYARNALSVILVVMFGLFTLPPLDAGEPTEQIKEAINQGVAILNHAKLDSKGNRAEAIGRLREIVYPLFDFQEMAKRSLGSHWRRLTPTQQQEFVAAFTELLEKTYADKIDLYDGQKVQFTGESADKDYAQVDSVITGKTGESFSVNYRLHRVDGRWRIYDVVVENISLVNNYRSQFHRVIIRSSFEELVKTIKEKAT